MTNAAGYRCYLEQEATGRWIGEGARLLGLTQQVSAEEFSAIRRGLHPETGEYLRPIRNVDRTYIKHDKDGNTFKQKYRAREVHDITISAPKSVSVQNMIDPRLAEAHMVAVEDTRLAMEQMCGPMVIAAYEHRNSRALDPNLHTHLVAGNLQYGENGWRTLDANRIYRSQQELTEHYRERLGEMLGRWGYQMSAGELVGISPELCDKFSQRSYEIEAGIQKYMAKLGQTERPSKKEISIIARQNRPAKDLSQSPNAIREYQLSRLAPVERERLEQVVSEAQEQAPKRRMSLGDSGGEKPLERLHWDYGEGFQNRRGVKIGL